MFSSNDQEPRLGVFISYASTDRMLADVVATQLRDVGYQPWVDFHSLTGGEEWKKSIDKALDQSQVVLVLLSPEAVASTWVNYEVDQALKRRYTVIPLMVRECNVPEKLASFHFVDFRTELEIGIKRLQKALLRFVLHASPVKDDTHPTAPRASNLDSPERKKLALVIEDTETTREFVRDILSQMDMEVHVAATRNTAVEAIQSRQNRYDFVTLDMNLGPDDEFGQTGTHLLDLLRRYQSDVPVVIITSVEFDKNKTSEFFVTGRIKHMLDKPVNADKLRALVVEHVYNGQAPADSGVRQ